MKTFQSSRCLFEILSVYPPSVAPKHWLIVKNLMIFLSLIHNTISLTGFLLFEANSSTEFADSFYTVATSMLLFFTLLEIVRRKKEVFQLLDNFESIIRKRNINLKMFFDIYLNMKFSFRCAASTIIRNLLRSC